MPDLTSKESSSPLAESPRSSGGDRAVKLDSCVLVLIATARAQPSAESRIDTFSGLPQSGYGGTATEGPLRCPSGVAVDHSGKLYLADFNNHRIRVLRSSWTAAVNKHGCSKEYAVLFHFQHDDTQGSFPTRTSGGKK